MKFPGLNTLNYRDIGAPQIQDASDSATTTPKFPGLSTKNYVDIGAVQHQPGFDPSTGFGWLVPDWSQTRVTGRAIDPGWKTDPIAVTASPPPPSPDLNPRGMFGGLFPWDRSLVNDSVAAQEEEEYAQVMQEDEVVLSVVRAILRKRRKGRRP